MAEAARAGLAAAQAQPLIARVFTALADGQFHSGEELARTLKVSRSAVWKAARALEDLGATLHAVRNRGYRLPAAGEPLDAAAIRAQLSREARERVRSVEVAWSTHSTNSVLLGRANPPPGTSEVFLAEHQTAGRGRRGRSWLAPPGGAICLSQSWTFAAVPADLGALSLVIGVCALRALRSAGVTGAALKWPNDLLLGERKLGGILIELRAESAGPACVVIGIGLNVALGATLLEKIASLGLAATDLASAGAGTARNATAAALVTSTLAGLSSFEAAGLKPFLEEWRAADALAGRAVDVTAAEGIARGIARGVDVHGALLLETRDGVRRFIAGDVSVRSA